MADDKQVRVALTLSAYDKMSRVVNDSVNKSITSMGRFNKSMTASMKSNPQMSIGMVAGITAAVAAVKPILEMTEAAEGAMTDLKISFMKAGGALDPLYQKFLKMGSDMAHTFKGGRVEMYGMINALIHTGISADTITRQFADSVAQYATVMKIPYDEAATQIGKIVKMSDLAQKDMAHLPDLLSRLQKLGVSNAEEVAAAVGKSGMGVMGLGGMKNMQSMAVIIANIAQATGSASSAGAAMQRIMVKMADPKQLMKMNAQIQSLGVKMQFFGKDGKFLGLQNMVQQLSEVPEALRQKVFGQVFGVRGAVAAATMAKMGVKGYNDTVNKMMTQDALAAKAAQYQAQAGYKMQIAWAGVKDIIIQIGLKLMPVFSRILDVVKKIVFSSTSLYHRMGFLGTVIKWVIIVMASLRAATWLLNMVTLMTTKNILFFTNGYVQCIKWLKSTILTMQYYTLVMKQSAIWGKIVAAAQWLFNTSLYGCPIVWIILGVMALIAAVVLMVKYWKPISAWFKGLWEGIKKVFAASWEWIKGVFVRFWNFLKGWGKLILIPFAPFLFVPVLIIQNWSKISGFFASLFSGIRKIFTRIVSFITGIGKVFYNAGKNIISMIWEGMKSIAMKPIELIAKVMKGIRNFLPFSPAKEGALKDIHRVKIIETIAQTMKPSPMIKAMRGVMNMVVGVKPSGSGSGYGQAGSGITLTYAPVVTFSGSGSKDDFKKMLDSHKNDIMRMMQELNGRNERIRY